MLLPDGLGSAVALEVTKLLLPLLGQQAACVLPHLALSGASRDFLLLLWGGKPGKFYKQQSHLITAEPGNGTWRLFNHHQLVGLLWARVPLNAPPLLCLFRPGHNRQHVWLHLSRAREDQHHLQSNFPSAHELCQCAKPQITSGELRGMGRAALPAVVLQLAGVKWEFGSSKGAVMLLYKALGCSPGDWVGSLCPGRLQSLWHQCRGLGRGCLMGRTQPGDETAFQLCLGHHLQRRTGRAFEAGVLGGVGPLSV